jgi:hypothetical protein
MRISSINSTVMGVLAFGLELTAQVPADALYHQVAPLPRGQLRDAARLNHGLLRQAAVLVQRIDAVRPRVPTRRPGGRAEPLMGGCIV